jgi:glutathione synthase/RimK-type ligase-like ATP-grasp enzyme
MEKAMWQTSYEAIIAQATAVPHTTDFCMGIIRDRMLSHAYYEAACMEMGVPYRLIDIEKATWVDEIRRIDCSAFLARPFVQTQAGKHLYDDRLRLIAEEMDTLLYPDMRSLWLFESKFRQADWMQLRGIPHPETWVFHDQKEAEAFVSDAPLPLVFKTDMGAAASGVKILHTRREAQRTIRVCFGRGYRRQRVAQSERQQRSALLQEFIPDALEWRIIRIGDSWFGRQKGKVGEFHSGTKAVMWETPPTALLDLCHEITDAAGFRSMCMDILETRDGRFLVIEFHVYFGLKNPHAMHVAGQSGRFIRSADGWHFEPGAFCKNNLCNLRIEDVLRQLGRLRRARSRDQE